MTTLTTCIINKISVYNKKESFKLPCGEDYCNLTADNTCKGYCSLISASKAKLSKKVMKCKNGK